jgi:hypothetical protein
MPNVKNIAAVSRIPNSMEVWWIGADGSVNDAFWYDGGSWQTFQLAPPGSASPNGGITAVSRIPNSMEVWWIGADGSVNDAFWYDGGSWQTFQLAPPGSASPNGCITAVSRIPSSMEVWWIGADGSVQDAFWYDGSAWQRFQLAPPGSASSDGGITAVSRISSSMEVWWIGVDGSVSDAYWYDGGSWQSFQLAPPGSASSNGGITAVSRIPNSMEVWWADGSVQDAYWYDGSVWQRFQLYPPLPPPPTNQLDFDWNPIVFGGGVPVGGYAHVTIRSDGTYSFTGHFHDSGALEYYMQLVWVVKDSKNIAYTFEHQGHVAGTFETGSRDDDWDNEAQNDAIRDSWANIVAGWSWTSNAQANGDLTNLLNSTIGAVGLVLGVVAIVAA